MYKVRTSIDDERKAKLIAQEIVESHSAVSVHIKKIETVYAWNDEVVNDFEWEIECLTTCPSEVTNLVCGMHSYELAEMIVEPLIVPESIREWCLHWCEKEEDYKVKGDN